MTDLAAPDIQDPRNGVVHLARRLRSLADLRGFWSLSDQAVLSLGNFLTNWLLLRCQAAWYGNYYTILNIILFLNNLHMAMVTYPLSVTSSGISISELRHRIRRSIGMTLMLAIPESIVIGLGTTATIQWGTSAIVRPSLIVLVIVALVCWQLQETVRRALMGRLEHRRAIFGDVVSYLGQAGAIFFIIHHGSITLSSVFVIIAVTSIAALTIQAIQVGVFLGSDEKPLHSMVHQVYHHWSLGKWILSSNITTLIAFYSLPFVIRFYHGPMEVALYSAALLLPNVSNPLQSGVANLITPVVAKVKAEAEARGENGIRPARRAAIKYALQGAILIAPFFAFLFIFPATALHFSYRSGSVYGHLETILRVFVVYNTMTYTSAMISSYLCGLGESRLPFYGQAANATLTVVGTLPLVAYYGVAGAAWGSLFPIFAQVLAGMFFVRRQAAQSGSVLSGNPTRPEVDGVLAP